jgi:hypothetical protein
MNTLTDLTETECEGHTLPTFREVREEKYGIDHSLHFKEVTDDEVDEALNNYDNADFACAMVEYEPVNSYASYFISAVLDFCDKQKELPIIKINGHILNLSQLRKWAHDCAEKQAYAMIEKGEL